MKFSVPLWEKIVGFRPKGIMGIFPIWEIEHSPGMIH